MKNRWKQIRSFKIGTPDGSTENYTLSENKDTGDFRIENDFGNISIEMERMSGYEFLRKVHRDVENDLEDELNELWTTVDYGSDDDLNSNCDGDPYSSIAGPNIDSHGYGAD